jgi:hypothetical protein
VRAVGNRAGGCAMKRCHSSKAMSGMTLSGSVRTMAILCCLLCAWASRAYAYRPFDSTDAAVAAKGEMEVECGPVGYVADADGHFVVVPAAILNFGFAEGWEVVVEGRHFLLVQPTGSDRKNTLRDTALSVKGVLRNGSLQDRTGPSVGLEVGLLLPGIGTDPGVGASFAGLVSQRWAAVSVHVNGTLLITHDHTLGAVAGAIVEGPSRWAIRPVSELTLEQDAGGRTSGLIGAIWQVRHDLSLDAGWRVARSAGEDLREFRAGFTWAFPLGSGSEERRAAPPSAPSRWGRGA